MKTNPASHPRSQKRLQLAVIAAPVMLLSSAPAFAHAGLHATDVFTLFGVAALAMAFALFHAGRR